MAIQRTLSIIKPDAVGKNVIGEIYSRFEQAGLRIVAAKMLRLDERTAGGFYAEHEGKPFYEDLIKFMTSGPVVVQVLEGEDPVLEWVKGTGLRPVLEALEGEEKDRFLALYAARLRRLYPRREGGETLYPFPRLFIVARM